METILIVFLVIVSIISFIIGCFQFKEKGFLFNNAYIYASETERKTMNMKPHYRQSAICFWGIGIIFLLNAIEMIVHSGWLIYAMFGVVLLLIAFAIISSIIIAKKYK